MGGFSYAAHLLITCWCIAWHRVDARKDGTSCTRLFFRHDGKQSCLTFDDHATALRFEDLIGKVGADKALDIANINAASADALSSPSPTG